jgi:hypothetical protein
LKGASRSPEGVLQCNAALEYFHHLLAELTIVTQLPGHTSAASPLTSKPTPIKLLTNWTSIGTPSPLIALAQTAVAAKRKTLSCVSTSLPASGGWQHAANVSKYPDDPTPILLPLARQHIAAKVALTIPTSKKRHENEVKSTSPTPQSAEALFDILLGPSTTSSSLSSKRSIDYLRDGPPTLKIPTVAIQMGAKTPSVSVRVVPSGSFRNQSGVAARSARALVSSNIETNNNGNTRTLPKSLVPKTNLGASHDTTNRSQQSSKSTKKRAAVNVPQLRDGGDDDFAESTCSKKRKAVASATTKRNGPNGNSQQLNDPSKPKTAYAHYQVCKKSEAQLRNPNMSNRDIIAV